jgi:hypothetical protein
VGYLVVGFAECTVSHNVQNNTEPLHSDCYDLAKWRKFEVAYLLNKLKSQFISCGVTTMITKLQITVDCSGLPNRMKCDIPATPCSSSLPQVVTLDTVPVYTMELKLSLYSSSRCMVSEQKNNNKKQARL